MWNPFKKKAIQTPPVAVAAPVATPPLSLGKPSPSAAVQPSSSVSADGTPKAWLVRPGEDVDRAGLGAFTHQLLADGVAFDLTASMRQLVAAGQSEGLALPPYQHIYGAGNFYLWLVQSFGSSPESLGKVGLMCATLFRQAVVDDFGLTYQLVGDEGLLYGLELDDYHVMFGQMDGERTLILMLPDDAHLFQLFDILGRELPPPAFENASAMLSLEKWEQ